jgi:hypothetical protein
MGGKGSGRKFRWKGVLIPKDPFIVLEFERDYIKFADSPEELFLKLSRMPHSRFYEVVKIEITRARGKEQDEIDEMLRKRIKEAERNA